MKKLLVISLFLATLISTVRAQDLTETTVRRLSFGVDVYTDIWMNPPEGVTIRTINQGANVFGMYDYPFSDGNFSFALGLGMGFHNMYMDSRIENIRTDTINFIKIPDSVGYKRSKLGLSYIDVPFEFRFKTDGKFRAGLGFKVGYLIDKKTKYVGEQENGAMVTVKQKQVNHLENFRFGPTVRIGYSWINVYAYYSVTKTFKKGLGPSDLYPISVGITLSPF